MVAQVSNSDLIVVRGSTCCATGANSKNDITHQNKHEVAGLNGHLEM